MSNKTKPQNPRFPTNPNPAPVPAKFTPPPRPLKPDVQKPGFTSARGPAMAPDAARKIIESKQVPGSIHRPNHNISKSFMGGFASNTVQGPDSIAELARALRNDPQLIYEFVANNIEFLPTYGLQKGGLGALIDGYGNAFDQSDLMVQLLTEAGFTARYVSGEIRLFEADWMSWLGTNNDVWAAVNLLANGGIPCTPTWDTMNFLWYIDVSHVWVKVTIGGTDYYFDPALKSYTNTAGIDLATATGFNETTFLSDAASGATLTSDYAEDWNIANVNSNLTDYSMNLVDWIRTNMPGAKVEDIVGGRALNKVAIPLLQTSISYVTPGSTPTLWTVVPDVYKVTMQVQYYDVNTSGFSIDETFFSADIHSKRLTLWFNGSLEAELTLDGSVIATSTAQAAFSWSSVLVTIVHPYPWWFADQSVWYTIWAGQYYAIAHAWGNNGREQTNIHSRALSQNIFDGGAATDENVLGETLNVIWHNLNGQSCQAADLLGRMTNSMAVYHHQVGLAYHFDGPGVDLGEVMSSCSSLENDSDQLNTLNTALCMHGVAMEEGVVTQVTNNPGANATRLINEAVAQGQKIYTADSTNWTANVRPNLVNYSTGDLDNIENWYINAGWNVFIPEDGATAFDSFTGYGYMAVPIAPYSGTVGIITGSLKGLVPATPQTPPNTNKDTKKNETPPKKDSTSTKDPVGVASGNFMLETRDLGVGAFNMPYGLNFSRFYDSNNNLTSGPLGLGWKHSFDHAISIGSDGFRGWASESPLEAVAAITESFISTQVLADQSRPLNKYLTLVVANQWLMNQHKNNASRYAKPDSVETFIKIPDGSFVAPGSGTDVLEIVSTLFVLTSAQGIKHYFNSDGQIEQIAYPYGVTVDFTYTSGKLTSVANSLDRELTLVYTGDILTSVSDGTGRDFQYSIDGTGRLVSITDANAEVTSYSYSGDGRLTEIFFPENPMDAYVTNVYDTLGRVKEQTVAAGGTDYFYLAGSRSEFVDANSNSNIVYLDRFGNSVKELDELGNVKLRDFDGRRRLIKETKPEGNYTEYQYDEKNNLLSITNVAKPGSGLSDIVVAFSWSNAWNRVETVTDGNGNVTSYSYDSMTGLLTNIEYPEVNSIHPEISISYNARGQVDEITDQVGTVTKYTYNATNETLESIVRDYGIGKLNLAVSQTFDSVGNCISRTDARGNTTSFDYDALRQLISTTDASPFSFQGEIGYDKNGNMSYIRRATGDLGFPWQTFAMSFGISNLNESLTDPLSEITSFGYDSMRRLETEEDPESRIVSREYDAVSHIHKLIDASVNDTLTCGYSDNGALSSLQDARSNITTKTLDGHDRAIVFNYPDSTTEEFTYDSNGNVLSIQNRAGDSIAFEYDALNRVVQKSPDGQAVVTMEYDLCGRITMVSTPVVSGNPASGDFLYTYDALGRLLSLEMPDGKEVQQEFDQNGNLVKTTWPDGYYVDRDYDELNRLVSIELNGSGTPEVQYTYDNLSRRTSCILGNGVVTDYEYNWDNTVSSIEHTFSGSSVKFDYAYNGAKELVSQTVDDAAFMWHPISAGTVTYGTATGTNTYPTVGGVTQVNDDNGCLTSDGVWNFVYDAEQHLIEASDGTTTVTFKYDGEHHQIQKAVGGTKLRYLYSDWQKIAEYDANMDTLNTRYVYGLGSDEPIIAVDNVGVPTYLHSDRVGSIVAVSDNTGANTHKNSFGPFGESGSLVSSFGLGFNGQQNDAEFGGYFFKHRYYLPGTGRFMQPDPLRFSASDMNSYTYARNNPFKYSDSNGKFAEPIGVSVGADTTSGVTSPVSALSGPPTNAQNPQGTSVPSNFDSLDLNFTIDVGVLSIPDISFNTCGGCPTGITQTCTVNCTGNCTNGCTQGCTDGCTKGLTNLCTMGCSDNCTTQCTNGCSQGCLNTDACTLGCSLVCPEPTNGCGTTGNDTKNCGTKDTKGTKS